MFYWQNLNIYIQSNNNYSKEADLKAKSSTFTPRTSKHKRNKAKAKKVITVSDKKSHALKKIVFLIFAEKLKKELFILNFKFQLAIFFFRGSIILL
jgi:hypothetical protein